MDTVTLVLSILVGWMVVFILAVVGAIEISGSTLKSIKIKKDSWIIRNLYEKNSAHHNYKKDYPKNFLQLWNGLFFALPKLAKFCITCFTGVFFLVCVVDVKCIFEIMLDELLGAMVTLVSFIWIFHKGFQSLSPTFGAESFGFVQLLGAITLETECFLLFFGITMVVLRIILRDFLRGLCE
jgi:hypothetical protein